MNEKKKTDGLSKISTGKNINWRHLSSRAFRKVEHIDILLAIGLRLACKSLKTQNTQYTSNNNSLNHGAHHQIFIKMNPNHLDSWMKKQRIRLLLAAFFTKV